MCRASRREPGSRDAYFAEIESILSNPEEHIVDEREIEPALLRLHQLLHPLLSQIRVDPTAQQTGEELAPALGFASQLLLQPQLGGLGIVEIALLGQTIEGLLDVVGLETPLA